MSYLSFRKGKLENINNAPFCDGQLLITTDENSLYFDYKDSLANHRVRLSDYMTVDSEDELPINGFESKLFLVKENNTLYRFRAETSSWIPVSASTSGGNYSLGKTDDKKIALIFTDSFGEQEILSTISLSMDNILDETWTNSISTISGKVETIENDYLKNEDKVALQSLVSGEETRAKGVEQSLSSRIDDIEESSGSTASALAEEITRATNTESAINTRIDNALVEHNTSLDAEIQRAQKSEESLSNRITSIESDYLTSKDKEYVEGLVSAESQRASQAETGLSNRITTITNDYLKSSDKTELSTSISNEVTRATNAESALSTAIGNEKTRAENAESTLTTNLSNEVTRATNREDEIASDLADEITNRGTSENEIKGLISTEQSRAESAESDLDDKIDTEITNRTNAINNLNFTEMTFGANETIDKISETNGVISVSKKSIAIAQSQVTNLSTTLTTIEGEISTETTNRTNADNALGGRIDSLTSTVNGVDGRVSDIEDDYLTSSDKSELSSATSGVQTNLTNHINDTTKHVTSTERNTWNNKQDEITSTNKLDYSLIDNPPLFVKVVDYGSNEYKFSELWDMMFEGTQIIIRIGGTGTTTAQLLYLQKASTTAFVFFAEDSINLQTNRVEIDKKADDTLEWKQSSIPYYEPNREAITNKVTVINSSSTDVQYPSAKAVYNALNNVVSGVASVNDKSGVVVLTTDDINEGTNNKYVTSAQKTAWTNKQDAISDLSTIRTGAGLGATALQPDDIADWAKEDTKPTYTASEVGALPSDTELFSGNYNDLTNKPTNVSSFTNDANYITSSEFNGRLIEVTYNVTTRDEIQAILDNGDMPFLIYNGGTYWYQDISYDNYYRFVSFTPGSSNASDPPIIKRIYKAKSSNTGGWGNGSITLYSTTHKPAWGDVTGKPTTFTPSTHNHTLSEITDFPSSDISANTTARHTHDNKSVLDGITAEKVAKWDSGENIEVEYYTAIEIDNLWNEVFV